MGKFLKPLATINLPKTPTFFGNFCKGVKIIHFFLVKSFLGNFYRHWAICFWIQLRSCCTSYNQLQINCSSANLCLFIGLSTIGESTPTSRCLKWGPNLKLKLVLLTNNGPTLVLFVTLVRFKKHFVEKTVRLNRIRTQIVRVKGEYADHLITTTAQACFHSSKCLLRYLV